MKFDRNKTFPYPVLRPYSDDYVDGDFQALADAKVRQTQFFASRQVVQQIPLYLAAHPQTDPVLLEQLRTAVAQQAVQSLPVNVSER